ncbi:hypothetical protein [uncultured Desulfovibrio sp.]|uniref:hypothetical protein n=1 Tax=uncultured Desulfovibrio sp. TaxID=167968 RepID=UPI0003B3C1BB|nr:hypothetical protein [uncultured Desulfovibrio sp.]
MDTSLITRAMRIIRDGEEASRAATIFLADPLPLWLFPAFFLGGLLLQAAALFLHRRLWLAAGTGFVLAAAAMDRDITLAVGQTLAFIGLLLCDRRKS